MLHRQTQGTFILLITAILWGFAFPYQVKAMEHLQPFSFMAARFTIGALSLVPLLLVNRFLLSSPDVGNQEAPTKIKTSRRVYFLASFGAGGSLFLGAALQQFGLLYTTAGKSGFITGLYLLVVPVLCFFLGQKIYKNIWFGAALAVIGLMLISQSDVEGQLFDINRGDVLTLICTIFWASQIVILGWASPQTEGTKLAFYQFIVCAALCWICAMWFEDFFFFNKIEDVRAALFPILYTGVVSTGVAFTLQIVGQRYVPSSPAAVIMSLEAVFAAIAGWALLNEVMSLTTFIGCSFMFAGMLVAQLLTPKQVKLYN